MSTQQISPAPTGARADRITAEECRIDDFVALTSRTTDLADYPYASGTEDRKSVV